MVINETTNTARLCKKSNIYNHQLSLADEKVVIEDEKKFQEYFLKEKRKATGKVYINPVSRTIELSLNREKLEQNQEEIIEQERLGPSYHSFQEDEYLKVEKLRQSELKHKESPVRCLALSTIEPVARFEGWFQRENMPIGLKGGINHESHEYIGRKNDKMKRKVFDFF